MSSGGSDTQSTVLPTAAVLCLAIGAYVTLLVVALVVRRYLKTKEFPCGTEGGCCSALCSSLRPSDCCLHLTEMSARCTACKEKVCCDCRLPSCGQCCCVGKPLFDCGRCDCTCSCQLPECSSINCCCFEIRIKA